MEGLIDLAKLKLSFQAGNQQMIRNERREEETKGIKLRDVPFNVDGGMGRKVLRVNLLVVLRGNSIRYIGLPQTRRKARSTPCSYLG